MSRGNHICALNLAPIPPPVVETREAIAYAATKKRIEEGVAYLERLERQRVDREDPGLGRAAEERIVWRELLELEVQEADEQMKRASTAGGRGPGG